jgi:hypothetical protein
MRESATPRFAITLGLALAWAGCPVPVPPTEPLGDAGMSDANGPDGSTDSGSPDHVEASDGGAADIGFGPDGGSCRDHGCGSGETCCEANGACYPSSCLSCCDFPVPDAGGCITSADCPNREYCEGQGCDTPGMCVPLPGIACTSLYAPVCGCNGTTYWNECFAINARERVASDGTCSSPDGGALSCTLAGCPNDLSCCGATGACYDPACGDGCCIAPPPDGGVGCTNDSQCPSTQFCAGNTCDSPGQCEDRPQACPQNYDPVCGCDGHTYPNECVSESEGERVAVFGACAPPDAGPRPDAGVSPADAGCVQWSDAELCQAHGAQCGSLTAVDNCDFGRTVQCGVCTGEEACSGNVCACLPESDQQLCLASSVQCGPLTASDNCGQTRTVECGGCGSGSACCEPAGQCYPTSCTNCCASPPPDAGVGCVPEIATNLQCPAGDYCAGSGCGTAGTCAPEPVACTDLYDPVCGCDGLTYSSPCDAESSGVRVASQGACASADAGLPCNRGTSINLCPMQLVCCLATDQCVDPNCTDCCPAASDAGIGCLSNADCPLTSVGAEYCAGTGCGTPGQCAPEPGGCSDLYDPVCGCDGQTYPNECYAAASGVRVEAQGACATADAGSVVADAGTPQMCGPVAICGSGETCCRFSSSCYPSSCDASVCCPPP